MRSRRVESVWYGVRNFIAFALESAPSRDGPVDAPVRTPIWTSWPALWAAIARSAIAIGTAFGTPAGVNPLKPTFCPLSIKDAASAAVSIGNGNLIGSRLVIHYCRAVAGREIGR